MLAHPVTDVVFVLSETISLGRLCLTAGQLPKGNYGSACKSAKETRLTET